MIYGFDIRCIMEYDISNMIDMWCIYDIYDIYYIYLCIYISIWFQPILLFISKILGSWSDPSTSIVPSPRGCHGSNELHEDDIPWEPTIRRPPPPNIDLDPPRLPGDNETRQRFIVQFARGKNRRPKKTPKKGNLVGWMLVVESNPSEKYAGEIGSWDPKFRDEN